MSEKTVIENTTKPLNKQVLIKQLTSAGIMKTDTLLVHASLSKLGFLIGGVQSALEALLEVVSEGTLVMPTHSGDLSDPKHWENPPVPKTWQDDIRKHMPLFNPETTPTRGMGKIAQQFLCLKNSKRSNHPQVSFTAYGKIAADITKEHPLTPMFGLNSPLGKLYQRPAKILMLGTSLAYCTAFHLSEILAGVRGPFVDGTVIETKGKPTFVSFEDFDYDDEKFATIGNDLIDKGIIRTFKTGQATSYIMEVKAAVDAAAEWLRKDENHG